MTQSTTWTIWSFLRRLCVGNYGNDPLNLQLQCNGMGFLPIWGIFGAGDFSARRPEVMRMIRRMKQRRRARAIVAVKNEIYFFFFFERKQKKKKTKQKTKQKTKKKKKKTKTWRAEIEDGRPSKVSQGLE